MAKTFQNTTLTLLISLTIFSFLSLTIAYDHHTLPEKNLGFKREKLTHLHFYVQDVVSGRNPTAVTVAEGATTNTSTVSFGLVTVLDDLLTVGPDPTSKQVGRAQGISVFASQSEVGLLMVLNYVFTEGKFNGSTLSVLGRIGITSAVKELPIVGGSGLFRFARGYAQARTYKLNTTSLDAIFEYNVYVLHY
ncbi:Disease resistance response protein [Parasponia andersonii]|uniref:Dirigent protein n=1 Tax=Parasponia andersonii TaxID=3476 RepID=A0A2P5DSB2_PARAD|nr:Disease resistance response protein [Parasponia andersonii]